MKNTTNEALFRNPEAPTQPLTSWWAEPVEGSFYAKCQNELARMRLSKEAHRMGLPMVVGSLDGKSARTS